jgi:hypothetical protein
MSAKNEGPECQNKQAAREASFKMPKHDSKITFLNQDGDEVGVLDFNGPGLSFEGVADLSAITFMNHLSRRFQDRLKEEYDRGFKAGKSSQTKS